MSWTNAKVDGAPLKPKTVDNDPFHLRCKITLEVLMAKFFKLQYYLLDAEEFTDRIVNARRFLRDHSEYRLGQAIYNALPPELADPINGTVLDMFHDKKEEVVIQKLLWLTKGYNYKG